MRRPVIARRARRARRSNLALRLTALLALTLALGASGDAATARTHHHTPPKPLPSAPPAPDCEKVDGNLVKNCAFASGVDGWQPQAATTFSFEPASGNRAPGALRMINEPASEAGAGTCVALAGGRSYELSGYLKRLQGAGECVAFLEEHASPDCSGGTTHFHEMVSTPLTRGAFTRVGGSAPLAPETTSVKAGFACYGEQDDDVSGVLLDDVVLKPAHR